MKSINLRNATTALALTALGTAAVAVASSSSSAQPAPRGERVVAAQAATFVHALCPRRSVEELVSLADTIVHGRVLSHEPITAPVPGTRYTLAVQSALKGEPGAHVTVEVAGGVDAEGRRLIVTGAPTFVDGDDVVLFLHRNADAFGIVGLEVGTLRVEDRSSGVATVSGTSLSSTLALPALFHRVEATLAAEEVGQ